MDSFCPPSYTCELTLNRTVARMAKDFDYEKELKKRLEAIRGGAGGPGMPKAPSPKGILAILVGIFVVVAGLLIVLFVPLMILSTVNAVLRTFF